MTKKEAINLLEGNYDTIIKLNDIRLEGDGKITIYCSKELAQSTNIRAIFIGFSNTNIFSKDQFKVEKIDNGYNLTLSNISDELLSYKVYDHLYISEIDNPNIYIENEYITSKIEEIIKHFSNLYYPKNIELILKSLFINSTNNITNYKLNYYTSDIMINLQNKSISLNITNKKDIQYIEKYFLGIPSSKNISTYDKFIKNLMNTAAKQGVNGVMLCYADQAGSIEIIKTSSPESVKNAFEEMYINTLGYDSNDFEDSENVEKVAGSSLSTIRGITKKAAYVIDEEDIVLTCNFTGNYAVSVYDTENIDFKFFNTLDEAIKYTITLNSKLTEEYIKSHLYSKFDCKIYDDDTDNGDFLSIYKVR